MCKPANDPYPWRNHAQLGGGSVAERLMSTLAYVWVERCSDVVGCGIIHQKISNLGCFVFAIYIYCIMNYDEHVLGWKCMCVASAEC